MVKKYQRFDTIGLAYVISVRTTRKKLSELSPTFIKWRFYLKKILNSLDYMGGIGGNKNKQISSDFFMIIRFWAKTYKKRVVQESTTMNGTIVFQSPNFASYRALRSLQSLDRGRTGHLQRLETVLPTN